MNRTFVPFFSKRPPTLPVLPFTPLPYAGRFWNCSLPPAAWLLKAGSPMAATGSSFDGERAGWLYEAELPEEFRLVEILLSGSRRDAGIGSQVICSLIDEAKTAGKPVRLNVDTTNTGALRLYERLGFHRIASDGFRHTMEFRIPDA